MGWSFYSHVNYSVTKIECPSKDALYTFYSHVNYSVTKIVQLLYLLGLPFTVT